MSILNTEHGQQFCLFREKKSPKLQDKRKLLKTTAMGSERNWNKRNKDGSGISLIIDF